MSLFSDRTDRSHQVTLIDSATLESANAECVRSNTHPSTKGVLKHSHFINERANRDEWERLRGNEMREEGMSGECCKSIDNLSIDEQFWIDGPCISYIERVTGSSIVKKLYNTWLVRLLGDFFERKWGGLEWGLCSFVLALLQVLFTASPKRPSSHRLSQPEKGPNRSKVILEKEEGR